MTEADPLAPWEQKLENSVEISTLCAFYGGLLTPKQQEAIRLHYDEDLSLGEIARQFGVSRQNVHDLITRSAEKLRSYEKALGTAARVTDMLNGLETARDKLRALLAASMSDEAKAAVVQTEALLTAMIQKQEEDAHGL